MVNVRLLFEKTSTITSTKTANATTATAPITTKTTSITTTASTATRTTVATTTAIATTDQKKIFAEKKSEQKPLVPLNAKQRRNTNAAEAKQTDRRTERNRNLKEI